MFPCFYKKYLGIDCPGCGMQRSIKTLLEGNLEQSVYYYPMLLPIAAMLLFLGLHLKFNFNNGPKVLVILFITNAIGIFINYVVKLAS